MGQHDPEDNPAKRHEPSDDIPRVSLAGAVANPHDIDVLRSLSREVSAAMEKYGCFIIVNHGVPREVCQDVEQTSKEFFDLPVEVKNEVLATADDFEGYDAGGELLYTSEETEEHLKDTRGQADAKESYQIWPSTSGYPGSTRSGGTKWPRLPQGFRQKYMAYYREMERLTSLIYQLLAIALGKEPQYFEEMNEGHLAVLRLLCYKDNPNVSEGGIRCSVHSDWGPLTLLRQANSDTCGMYLQIVDPSGEWMDVKTSGDEILVNTGDMMDSWTNHRWRAIKHRVVQPEGPLTEPRYSFAYFHAFNPESMADPRDFDPEVPSRPVNQWDYVVRKKVNSMSAGDAE
ncbi:hypothetical protein FOZ63_022150 [Perkinsus olseni]|uniref:Fe2OG dioxygenase domain-containing protein n=1 Tax=Perkinsus olseni TaxID=32597 RepID=A0A7J6Q3A7_PEROL|nr:hypothetical protein FOZ63_022150 [Perkinsus olseni]